MKKPIIAIPTGDPAGIGPEIVAKALLSPEVKNAANCIAVGNKTVMKKIFNTCDINAKLNVISHAKDSVFDDKTINLLNIDNIDSSFKIGEINAMCGRAAFEYIELGIKLAMDKSAHAVATAPINKESLHVANVPYIGHTEIFGALTGTSNPLTMFETRGLRIFFLTRHLSLKCMLSEIKKDKIKAFAWDCKKALSKLGVSSGTMAIAGLNPHCGEHGLFGNEEVLEISPAVEELRQEGLDIVGPIGADSVFHQALQGKYVCVLSLYHDQGHIAAKTYDFNRTVSITNNLPILRTSVDHGTAFDIAGKNIADPTSMIEAILVAAKYAPSFNH